MKSVWADMIWRTWWWK